MTECGESDLMHIVEEETEHFAEHLMQSIACQVLSALFYLHSRRILHRDLKPQNILIFPGGVVKLCDFGFSRVMSPDTVLLNSVKGTPLYMAPEVTQSQPAYDHTADLWSLGVILFELFTGHPPFFHVNVRALHRIVAEREPAWPKQMSPVFKDFLQGLLQKKPSERLQWPDLLNHPFLAHGVKGTGTAP